MSTSKLTRRAVFAALGVMSLAGPRLRGSRIGRARVSPSGVHVDVEPLRANAGEPTASWVAEFLPGQLAQNLAERRRPPTCPCGSIT